MAVRRLQAGTQEKLLALCVTSTPRTTRKAFEMATDTLSDR